MCTVSCDHIYHTVDNCSISRNQIIDLLQLFITIITCSLFNSETMMLSAGSTFFLLVSQLHQSDAYIVQPSPLNRKLNEINSFNERITINNQASDPKNINGHDEIGEQINAVSSKSDNFNQDCESLPPRFKNDISSLKMRLSQIEKQREKALEHINDDMKHFVSFEDTDSEIAYLKGEILRKEEETQEIILKMEQDMMYVLFLSYIYKFPFLYSNEIILSNSNLVPTTLGIKILF